MRHGDVPRPGEIRDRARDPRGHTCSVAFTARARATRIAAGDDAAAAEWLADWRKQNFAFDHAAIVADAVSLWKRAARA